MDNILERCVQNTLSKMSFSRSRSLMAELLGSFECAGSFHKLKHMVPLDAAFLKENLL